MESDMPEGRVEGQQQGRVMGAVQKREGGRKTYQVQVACLALTGSLTRSKGEFRRDGFLQAKMILLAPP